MTKHASGSDAESKPELPNAREYLVLDGAGRVVAAIGGGICGGALAPENLVGHPIVEVLAEHDGLCLPAGLAAAVAAALDRMRSDHGSQVTPPFDLPVVAGQRALWRFCAVLAPLFDRTGAPASVVMSFEFANASTPAPSQDQPADPALLETLRERTLELERANEELIRVIGEQLKTEKALQRSQEQLYHAQRLEAVGRLAGGIAHDFNNLLSVVLGYSISVIAELPEDAPLRADIEEIRRAGERAAELTQQLLAFSRQQVLEPKVLDLNDVVMRVDRMIRRLVGEDVEVVTLPANPLWKVKVDPGQIEQVILNLVINARDAMPNGGRLTIETENIEFDDDYAQVHLGATPGPHVMMAVSDTGVGMDKDTQARIFEPFFTTKEKGKGTGLGLSMVFGIVKQSGGHIWLYSEPGRGTTFKVCFPRTNDSGDRQQPARKSPPLPRGTETILLVEDDAQLRALARTILVRHGYTVLDAPTPSEALTVSARCEGTIALLVTDVVMPQMSGRELSRRILELRPEIKVLYMSGYTDTAIVHNGILDEGVAFLQKPITPPTFARKVREVLDGPGTTY